MWSWCRSHAPPAVIRTASYDPPLQSIIQPSVIPVARCTYASRPTDLPHRRCIPEYWTSLSLPDLHYALSVLRITSAVPDPIPIHVVVGVSGGISFQAQVQMQAQAQKLMTMAAPGAVGASQTPGNASDANAVPEGQGTAHDSGAGTGSSLATGKNTRSSNRNTKPKGGATSSATASASPADVAKREWTALLQLVAGVRLQ